MVKWKKRLSSPNFAVIQKCINKEIIHSYVLLIYHGLSKINFDLLPSKT